VTGSNTSLRRASQAAVGAAVLVAGLLLLLLLLGEPLQVLPDWRLGRLWPIILVIAGLVPNASPRGRHGVRIFMVTLGVVLLLHSQEIVAIGDGWPLLIVGQGLAILVRSGRGCALRREPDYGC
jgi:hypothetical protein